MKKLFTVIIAMLLIIMSCITVAAQTPIAISNEAELKAMSSNRSYYLQNDITLSGDFTPINGENIHLDGRKKKIINLKITVNAQKEVYAGLFAKLDGSNAIVENLTLENAKINVTGGNTVYAGAVCGKVMTGGRISNCRVSGEIVVNSASANADVGGIAGQNDNKISLCENIAKITVTARSANVGGIVGDQARSDLDLDKCQNSGEISVTATASENYAGGIAGKALSNIKNCANYGSVSLTASGEGWVGGISALNTNGEIAACFSAGTLKCDAKTIGYVDPVVAKPDKSFSNNFYLDKIITGLNPADVKTASVIEAKNLSNTEYFKEFDFDNVWKITSNGPVLSCITAKETQNKVENNTSSPSSSGSSDTTSNGSGITSGSNTSGDSSDVSQTVTSGDGTTTSTSSNGGATTGTPSGEENGKFPVWIIIVLVAVVLLAGAAVVVVKNKKNSSED